MARSIASAISDRLTEGPPDDDPLPSAERMRSWVVLYFGFGSNLDSQDLRRWAESRGHGSFALRPHGRAWLPDHELAFDYRSPVRGGGALNVREAPGRVVPGALFDMDERAWSLLDAKEGVALGRYERVRVTAIDEEGRPHAALTYRVAKRWREGAHVDPTADYANAVRRGLAEHRLPAAALERALRGEEAAPLPDAIFVYGTLKAGQARNAAMHVAPPRDVRHGHARGVLVDLGAYPGLVIEAGEGRVQGELYRYADPATLLPALDRYEDFAGYGDPAARSMYLRTILTVETAAGPVRAWSYLYLGPAAPRISDGVWGS